MRHDTNSLDVPVTVSNGTAMDIRELEQVAVFVGSEGAAPVNVTGKIQGTVHGLTQWIDIAALTNANFTNGLRTAIDAGYTKLRIVTSTFTSGAPVAIVSGKNTRTDR